MTPDGDAPLGLRERKKRETRVALSRATIRLCVERGWENVTVEDIAAAANVSVRTFRNYFAGKAEAVAASHVERMLRIADELRARPAAEPLWDAVTAAVLAEFGAPGDQADQAVAESPHARRWRDGVRLMLAEPALQGEIVKANAAAQGELARAVAERTDGDAAHDVYPKLLAAVVSAASSVAVEHSLTAEPPTAVGPLLAEVLERLAMGLRAP
ncbi:TetR/AcrR family transcriptional regulator [Streptomyces hainanensis]|uniref:TetR family transcriptional regulator n=1 Tax=Streptomyces hainanensis TaxID=402648 RepID=A0A4R4TYT4_9ACTN|nr:TetR family transcriptional regulator [Streptomyces hainanensis]TDC80443.1 TetR family transcriptional regulator [Streptomyces hainanensis]